MTCLPRSLAVVVGFLGAICQLEGFLWGAEPLRVLFIGNSYTYFNNSPEIFAELARAQTPGRQVEARMVAIPGETLISIWERSNARQVLRSSKWDYVILQDQSQLGDGLREGRFVVNDPTLLHWGVRLFDSEIKRQGARTVLLLTWSRKAEPEQQADLNYAYDSIARETGAVLAPVGPAWQECRARHPNLDLYAKDGSHPSPLGSYLLACVLVRSLLSGSGTTLPIEVFGHPVDNSGKVNANAKQTLVSARREEATALQAIAGATVRSLNVRGGYLDAPPPIRQERNEPSRPIRDGERFEGHWTGKLTYFPSPANVELDLRTSEAKCEGNVAIDIPENRQRYESEIALCSIDGNHVSFSVVLLPIPYLVDQYSGWLAEGELSGTVKRSGRELANSMTGSWSLQRANSR